MNFFFIFQQPNEWTGHMDFLFKLWRLIVLVFPLLLLLLVIHYLLPYLVVYYKKEQLYRRLPSPVTSPILGRILGHLELYWNAPAEMKNLPPGVSLYHMLNQLVNPIQEAGESLFLFRLGPFSKLVFIIKGEAAKALLSSSKHLQKSPEYEFFKEIIGESLLTGFAQCGRPFATDLKLTPFVHIILRNVVNWKMHRNMLTPAFHLEILHKFLPAMNAHSRVFCKMIASKMNNSTGKTLLTDIRPLTINCALDIFCETSMGVQLNCQTRGAPEGVSRSQRVEPTAGQQFAEVMFICVDLVCERVLTPWLHPNFLYRLSALGRKTAKYVAIGRNFVNSVIAERKVTLSKQIEDCKTVEQARACLTDAKRLIFLDYLLVNHLKGGENALNLPFIEDEVYLFMVAGMDTTSTTLQMALLLLGHHTDKQALLHQELDAIFADNAERDISLEDIRQMTYLEKCIKETMRLYPSIPLVGRTLSENLQIDEYLVPEGATVYVNIAAINRDPECWADAEQFIPERFSPDSTELGVSNSYFPFSGGLRNCMGSRFAMLVLKIFLATLLRDYTVRSLTAKEDIQLSFFIIAKSIAPISIEFDQRK